MTDVAVVGAGIAGLSVATAVAARGASVTVYERAAPGGGQSGGDSRIFRHGHDDPRLIAFARSSLVLWREWEERFGVELLAADGVLALGPHVSGRLALLQAAGVRARLVGRDEAAEALPLLAVDDALGGAARGDEGGACALLDEDGGVIRTTAAIGALAAALGSAVVADEVLSVRPLPAGTVEVRAAGGTAEHDRVVVCAGRDTARLAAGAGLSLPVRHSAHVRLAFPIREPAPARLACLLDGSGAFGAPSAYADPLPGNRHYAVGLGDVAARADGSLLDADGYAAMAERIRAYAARALPGVAPEPTASRHCWVTELPWSHDAIAAWERGGLVFVAGNNLFKHAPALGDALAAAALGDGLPAFLHPGARLGELAVDDLTPPSPAAPPIA